jgi:cytoskeletal protein CcmA (bactofilin family)
MDATAHIGPSIHIKGDVTAQEPLTISGHVDGTIEVSGHALTVAPDASLNATVNADIIIVGGSVKGSLLAGTRILVRDTATIEGDLSAPVIGLADGATVSGRVETTTKRSANVLPMAS